MNPLRSDGWSVHPSFVPDGPHGPVTLLADDFALTQLAGEPAVAWQTPWTELSNLQLTRFARGLAFFATVDGVRYSWRTLRVDQFDAMADVVEAHGGTVVRQRRRAGTVLVAVIVLVAALVGGLGAWLNRANTVNHELAAARAVNLTLNDLPKDWSHSAPTILSYLFSPSGQVVTSTTTSTSTSTTTPARNSTWTTISHLFQSCLGVSAQRDRVYGAAGQMPDYQVSSPVFTSVNGDVVVTSMTQYYATTTMVRHDVAEMSKRSFGSCFATSNAAVLFSIAGVALPTKDIGTTWKPTTFLHGFAAGGVVKISSGAPNRYLVIATTASGHFEVTLAALVDSWPQSQTLVANLVNTLMSRASSTSSTPA